MSHISNLINYRFLFIVMLFLSVFFSPSLVSAADRYWVGGTANWDTSIARWSATSGGASGASVPTASDNCYFNAASGVVTVTLNTATRTCLNADFTGFTGTFAGTQTWTISGGLTLGAGMTRTYTGAITFNATSGTNVITSNGIALSSAITFNGTGGTWQLADTFTSSAGLTLTAGTFDANGQTVVLNGSDQRITGSFTFANLTRTGTSIRSMFTLANDLIVTGTLTLNGNSAAARLLVRSSVQTTQRTITAGSVTGSNFILESMIGAGAASWDLSAVSGGSGDAGGSTGITFTTPATQYWVGDGGNWSDVSHWASTSGGVGGTGRVPLVQDTARFDANSFTIAGQAVSYDVDDIGSTDWTGVTNSPSWSNVAGVLEPEAGLALGVFTYGSLTHDPGMSITGTSRFVFRGYGNQTITNNGVEWPTNKIVDVVSGGTYTLLDDLTINWFRVRGGTFDANDHNITLTAGGSGQFMSSNFAPVISTPTRTIKMGSGTWTLSNTGAVWNNNPDNGQLTIDPGTATVKVTATGTISFQTNSDSTYPNFWNATDGSLTRFTNASGATGNTTWNDIKIDPGNGHLFLDGTTTTISSMTATGTVDDLVTIGSTNNTTNHTLVKAGGGVFSGDYMTISKSTATPADTWYAGTHSFDGGGNIGWIFTDPPVVESSTSSGSRRSVRSTTSTEAPTINPVIPSSPSNPTPSTCTITTNILKLNSRGSDVSCLQQKLNTLLTLNLDIDGIFGPLTKAAVVNFQTKNNLVPDGIVGPLTRGKI